MGCDPTHPTTTATSAIATATADGEAQTSFSDTDPPIISTAQANGSASADLAAGHLYVWGGASGAGQYPPAASIEAYASLSDWLHFNLGTGSSPVPITVTASITGYLTSTIFGALSNHASWYLTVTDGSDYLGGGWAAYPASAYSPVWNSTYLPQGYDARLSGQNEMSATFMLDPTNPNLQITFGLGYQGMTDDAGYPYTDDNGVFLSAQLAVTASDGVTFTSASGVFPGSASAVPEPAGWGTMILGFGAIGGTFRRRRRPALAG